MKSTKASFFILMSQKVPSKTFAFSERKLGDKKGRAESAQLVADVHFALASMGMGNPQEALKASQEAVQLYQENGLGGFGGPKQQQRATRTTTTTTQATPKMLFLKVFGLENVDFGDKELGLKFSWRKVGSRSLERSSRRPFHFTFWPMSLAR